MIGLPFTQVNSRSLHQKPPHREGGGGRFALRSGVGGVGDGGLVSLGRDSLQRGVRLEVRWGSRKMAKLTAVEFALELGRDEEKRKAAGATECIRNRTKTVGAEQPPVWALSKCTSLKIPVYVSYPTNFNAAHGGL